MKASVYLLAAVMLLAASCGDSNNKGPEVLFLQTSNGAVLTDSTLTLTALLTERKSPSTPRWEAKSRRAVRLGQSISKGFALSPIPYPANRIHGSA